MAKEWYVVHTYSGFENKVRLNIVEQFRTAGVEDQLGEIVIPTEQVVEVKGGKRRTSNRKFFPGYILIEMDCDEQSWYLVKDTPKVTGFLGGTTPSPLSEAEVQNVVKQMKGEAEKPAHKVEFEKGENIRVVDGPFVNFTGVIDEVHPDRGKVKVMVSIFGRTTPVELEMLQVEKV
ncbi:MAG: transcription termination/antitermination protein NusG [Nitrospinota bacterium]|nr:transcription termination/antitermination protein NusG [Nitrospinota bacterium]MDP7167299.1 transcription termination/antitermination protein NusG [Nitrospinota bacterium]MDP7371753.1 transcription termination/antitermination protein NusG [Nitrospinota bacterium]MDP7504854.1 transcription termination/antitermination protein NusG [Nitrospinota bacterium]MDP7663241.1 transcription termination/antitermination protein NusG [Nitrospinota bacterium]